MNVRKNRAPKGSPCPRHAVTFDHETHEAIKSMATAQGVSFSSMVVSLAKIGLGVTEPWEKRNV